MPNNADWPGDERHLGAQPDEPMSAGSRMVSLDSVLAIIDLHGEPPDGYFYARQHERAIGWAAAAERIRGAIVRMAAEQP